MKRWPLIASFVLFLVLCASAAYWAMQLFRPQARPVAAPPSANRPLPQLEAAAQLFGGRSNIAVASNFQLRGVIASGTAGESIAILSADGKPAQAVRANAEVVPGVIVKEVHPRYVLLSEGGAIKRVELPEGAKGGVENVPPPMPQASPEPQPQPQPQPNPAVGGASPVVQPPSEPPHTPTMGVPPGMGMMPGPPPQVVQPPQPQPR